MRFKVSVDSAAAAMVPEAIKADGKLTAVTTGNTAPLSLFTTGNNESPPWSPQGGDS